MIGTATATDHSVITPTTAPPTEGAVARTIEQQTAKLPSDIFLWGALAAIGLSAYLEFTGKEEKSRFIGQWVSPFLLFGVYNKLVKVAGSDRVHPSGEKQVRQ